MSVRLHEQTTGVPHNPLLRALYGIVWVLEEPAKKALFGCQGCGHCVLKWTALTCPMKCPKQLRNGPCGGVRPNGHCEVYPERECQWHKIYRRSKMVGRTKYLRVIQPPVDWRLKNTSSWINHFVNHKEKAFFEELWGRTRKQAKEWNPSREKQDAKLAGD